ncbi:uncharacterized protein ACN2A1_000620 isoform 1-T4 [Glossina fuscipes fuscipes]
MQLILLSVLILGSSVSSVTIGYPYQTRVLAYSPGRGDFSVPSGIIQGYIRYVDNTGVERLVGYSYPRPVLRISQTPYTTSVQSPTIENAMKTTPMESQQTKISANDAARDVHFRAWCLQQYQALQHEMDTFRSQGREPPADMLAKFQPLERIIATVDYSTIADIPEIKRIHDEHSHIWNEAISKGTQMVEHVTDSRGEMNDAKTSLLPTETVEQKLAREEHLRIYNEQLALLKQLESQRLHDIQEATRSQQMRKPNEPMQMTEMGHVQQGSQDFSEMQKTTIMDNKSYKLSQALGSKSAVQDSAQQLAQKSDSVKDDTVIPQPTYIGDTSEVKRAREEHLRLVNEVKSKYNSERAVNHAAPKVKGDYDHKSLLPQTTTTQQGVHHSVHIEDTPEVTRAREEHLRIFNEIKANAQQKQAPSKTVERRIDNVQPIAISEEEIERIKEAERKQDEDHFMEMERIREAERLQQQQKQLELERVREAERLAEEQYQMEAELMRLKQEEETRLEMDRLLEAKRLRKEEEELKQQLQADELEQIKAEEQTHANVKLTSDTAIKPVATLQYAQYTDNPYITTGPIIGDIQTAVQPHYVRNTYLKGVSLQPSGLGSYTLGQQPQPAYYIVPYASVAGTTGNAQFLRYAPQARSAVIQQSTPLPPVLTTTKGDQQAQKEDNSRIAAHTELEKATREHFRAHEVALEQLRLAALKDGSSEPKDCN